MPSVALEQVPLVVVERAQRTAARADVEVPESELPKETKDGGVKSGEGPITKDEGVKSEEGPVTKDEAKTDDGRPTTDGGSAGPVETLKGRLMQVFPDTIVVREAGSHTEQSFKKGDVELGDIKVGTTVVVTYDPKTRAATSIQRSSKE